jgi:hypothetical protein
MWCVNVCLWCGWGPVVVCAASFIRYLEVLRSILPIVLLLVGAAACGEPLRPLVLFLLV